MDLPCDLEQVKKVKTFRELDTSFTIKVHPEYTSADDFYDKIPSDRHLPNIRIPLLIVNALNDPMLGDKCYPIELANTSENIYLEMPKYGGHVGFSTGEKELSYMEHAADRFIDEVIYSPSQT